MDLNTVMLIWRATSIGQLKLIESTNAPVINFSLATNRKYKNAEGNILEDSEYHRCVAYGNQADILGKYLTKGKKIYVEGRLRTKKWQDSEGHDRFSTEVLLNNFIFLDTKLANSDEIAGDPLLEMSEDETPF